MERQVAEAEEQAPAYSFLPTSACPAQAPPPKTSASASTVKHPLHLPATGASIHSHHPPPLAASPGAPVDLLVPLPCVTDQTRSRMYLNANLGSLLPLYRVTGMMMQRVPIYTNWKGNITTSRMKSALTIVTTRMMRRNYPITRSMMMMMMNLARMVKNNQG